MQADTTLKITVLAENRAHENLNSEHGLSMLMEYRKNRFLFDLGLSSLWLDNAAKMNIYLSDVKKVFLSHGHRDHTGGLQYFSGEIFCTSQICSPHYSFHPGKPKKILTMPDECQQQMKKSEINYINDFEQIFDGVYSTGNIPRISSENTGGPFYSDEAKSIPDLIEDESALLFSNGVLVHGCCHSGIINTLEHCRKNMPDLKVNTIVGGLHLLNADTERLSQTAEYFKKYGIRKLYLMHCTGDDAILYLKDMLDDCEIFTPCAGDILSLL